MRVPLFPGERPHYHVATVVGSIYAFYGVARAAANLELDALGWSVRVSFDDRIFGGVPGFG